MRQSDAAQGPTAASVVSEVLRNRGFLACLALLIVFAVSFQVLATLKGIRFKPLPVPLRKPLDQLDQAKLQPYTLVHSIALKPDMVDALGTTEYLQWVLNDTSIRQQNRPEKQVSLFVTYYTGKPDQVPHVPEVCYLGSGFRVVDESFRDVPVPALGRDFTVPIKVVEFERSGLLSHDRKVVMYTFHANGQFCRDRRDVQAVLGNPLVRHAYFSKLEITFGSEEAPAAHDAALAAGERFLQVIIPVLLGEHLPDWNAVQSRTPQTAPAPQSAARDAHRTALSPLSPRTAAGASTEAGRNRPAA